MRIQQVWRSYLAPCGKGTQPSVASLPNLWRDYLWRGHLVARLPATITGIGLAR